MIELHEVQAIVDQLAPGVSVAIRTTDEPTYELGPDGKRTARLNKRGAHILHPVTAVHLTLGRVTCSVDLAVGAGSPHEREPRSRAEVLELLRSQVGNLVVEAVRKPRSAAEHDAWQAEQAHRGAAAAAAARASRAAEEHASLTDEERAAAAYHAEHGEPDYFDSGAHLEHHDRHLAAAVVVGTMSSDQAAAERARIAAWKERCAKRRAKEG
jgi:hypothetical protein